MKTIIAGSRWIEDPAELYVALGNCPWIDQISEVVCGMAKGADMLGFDWAQSVGIPIKRFYADWDRYGKRAGPIRNRQMGDYADALIALWDNASPGTSQMIAYMRHLRKPYIIHGVPRDGT